MRAFGKMHAALRRAGVTVGRHQTGRLMRELGLAGVRRDKARRPPFRTRLHRRRRT